MTLFEMLAARALEDGQHLGNRWGDDSVRCGLWSPTPMVIDAAQFEAARWVEEQTIAVQRMFVEACVEAYQQRLRAEQLREEV